MKLTPFLALPLLLAACHPTATPDPTTTPAKTSSSRYPAVDELVKKKEYGQATEQLEALRATAGDEPELIGKLVALYRVQGNPARAILRAREGIAAHADAKALYLPLAELYMETNQLQEARAALEAGRKQGADNKEVSLTLGSVLGRLGELELARAEFEHAGRQGLEPKLVNYNLALLLTQQNQSVKAREMFEDVVKNDPEWAPGRRELARVLLVLDKENPATVERALDLLTSVKDSFKDDWRAWETMGDAWLLKGDYEASVFAYTEALRLGESPKSVQDRYVVAKKKLNEVQAKAAQIKGMAKNGSVPDTDPKNRRSATAAGNDASDPTPK